MKIAHHDCAKKVFVIAEVGNNHEGNFSLAEDLIGLAARAGADAVKFQTIIPEKLVAASEKERIQVLKQFQFSYDQFKKLSQTAKKENILFLSTPFDLESVDALKSIVPALKIASGDNNYLELLEAAAKTGLPVILSGGMSTFSDLQSKRDFIQAIWKNLKIKQSLAILHCVTSYPVSPEFANLGAIRELAKLDITIGYSDHTLGIQACVLAVALGSRIIEKHFTVSKKHSTFRDHQLSADPADLSEMIQHIREAEILLGDGIKKIETCEVPFIKAARRSLAVKKTVQKGEKILKEHLTCLRPASGLLPGDESKIIGRKSKDDLTLGQILTESHFE